jgi:prolyl 4-hydroxylase
VRSPDVERSLAKPGCLTSVLSLRNAFSEGKYAPSIVYDGVSERVDPSTRLSDRALLERDDVVRCLEERARSFQGWRPYLYIERMFAQRYNVSGHYRHHYDWTGASRRAGRVSTFMVYLNADCTGGGTNFPRLSKPRDRKWCRFIECDSEDENTEQRRLGEGSQPTLAGVTFKPIKGNAVFWENLRPDGTGYPETWHAAFPVLSGRKVGLNIWSWYQPPARTQRKRH